MSSASDLSTILISAAAGALTTGLVSFSLLRIQNQHDAEERTKDRQSATDTANADRMYSNLMKVHLAVVGYVTREVDRARLWAQASQGYDPEHQIPARQSTDEELSLSFLLADGAITSRLLAFDKEIETFRNWCYSRRFNQVRADSDGWSGRAQVQADLISDRAQEVISAQRKDLGLSEWPDMKKQLFIQIPTHSIQNPDKPVEEG